MIMWKAVHWYPRHEPLDEYSSWAHPTYTSVRLPPTFLYAWTPAPPTSTLELQAEVSHGEMRARAAAPPGPPHWQSAGTIPGAGMAATWLGDVAGRPVVTAKARPATRTRAPAIAARRPRMGARIVFIGV